MKRLRNLVRKNMVLFNHEEPNPGHFERFEAKLATVRSLKKQKDFYQWGIAALSAAAILICVFVVFRNMDMKSHTATYEYPNEIKEIQLFYENKFESNYKTLLSYVHCPKQEKEIQSCMEELNRSLEEIQNDMGNIPGDDEMINVIVNHYKLKLEVTDLLIDRARNYCN